MEPSNGGAKPESPERWQRLTDLFGRLLESADPAAVLAAEPDPELRADAERLWQNHGEAAAEDFLSQSTPFEILPVFQAGQVLAQRFEVLKPLGAGGMGEVYLAQDRKLHERVAIKAIARLLATSDSIRRRFVSEVQNARRVTHPNVCRIYDLFEDGPTAFFAMEYVEGAGLGERVAELKLNPPLARQVARQMAEGLHAAHRNGIVHGDFKPSNVILTPGANPRAVITDFGLARAVGDNGSVTRQYSHTLGAGTLDYMAPELLNGQNPTQLSDIYAFGMVAEQLLPGEKLWKRCSREKPQDRPTSMQPILDLLQPGPSRRYWTGGAIAAAAGIGAYTVWNSRVPSAILGAGSRVLVNGFRAAADQVPAANLARSMFLSALQQSPRLRAIADQDLLPTLRRLKPGAKLPAEGEMLAQLVSLHRAAYWLEAQVRNVGERYSLNLSLVRAADSQVISQEAFGDLPAVAALAQKAAEWLRRLSGEGSDSFRVNPTSAASYTTSNPDAAQKYFEAMTFYAMGDMQQAMPLLEEAIRLDPEFAQAHNILAMCLNVARRHADAFKMLVRARELSRKLPERERAWVESNYYALLEDPRMMVEAARRNVGFFPDEPRYYRVLAYTLCRAGNPAESIPYSRKCLELSLQSELNWNELSVNLCEAGQFAEALRVYERGAAQGNKNPYLQRGRGLAYLGLGNYSEALESFTAMVPKVGNYLQGAKILMGDVPSAMAEMQQDLARAESTRVEAEIHRANEYLCGTQFLLGNLSAARVHVTPMTALAPFPPSCRFLQCTAFWAFRLGDQPDLETVSGKLDEIEGKWANAHTTAMALYARGLLASRHGDAAKAEALLLQSSGMNPSIFTLLELALHFSANSKLDLADEYFAKVEERRGTVLKLWFPGLLLYSWWKRAEAAAQRKDFATARTYANKVLDHWARQNPNSSLVHSASQILSRI